MKIKLLSTISIAVLIGGMSIASASDFKYSYIEGVYQDVDLDGEAYKISGSYGLNSNINITGDYTNGEITNPAGGGDLNFDEATIGLGYHTGISSATDFTANIKLAEHDNDLTGDDTGYGIGVGIRHMLTDKIEVGSNIDYVDVNDIGDTTFKLNSRYYLNDRASLGLSYSTSSEGNDIILGGFRFDF